MNDRRREIARGLANKHCAAGDPLGWFEALYAQADGDSSIIPWADLTPNPNLVHWLNTTRVHGKGQKALKVGCSLGDDAEELASSGFDTTAFDISESAIAWCCQRHPDSAVTYLVADLFDAPAEWQKKFSLVVESYTLQVLPSDLRRRAIQCIASFVGSGGVLLVISRGREPANPEGDMPWPLIREELTAFCDYGLREMSFEDYFDKEDPPVRRFRAVYHREG